jgi:hypothetical protein
VAIFRWVVLVCAAASLVYIIWSTGVEQLWNDLVTQGWAIIPYLALTGIENSFHTLSSKWCFSREHRSAIPFWRLFLVYQTGYALNLVTPTAEIGGEIARGVVFEKYVPGSEAASAVIINKFAYSIARMIIAAAFTGLTVIFYPLDTWQALLIAAGSILTTGALLLFALLQAKGLFGPALLRAAFFLGDKVKSWIRTNIGELDRRLRDYYINNRSDLFMAIVWDLCGFVVGTLQKWYLMWILLSVIPGSKPVTLLDAAAVWGITTLLDMIFFFVTGGMGVHEGGHKLAFEAIGRSGEKGVALSVVARIDQFFWIVVGLVAYMVEMASKKRAQAQQHE